MERYFVRPTYGAWGVFETLTVDRARLVYEGTEEDCRAKKAELEKEGNA